MPGEGAEYQSVRAHPCEIKGADVMRRNHRRGNRAPAQPVTPGPPAPGSGSARACAGVAHAGEKHALKPWPGPGVAAGSWPGVDYAPRCPTMVTDETFWLGNPPRLCVTPRLGSLSWRWAARPVSCRYIS